MTTITKPKAKPSPLFIMLAIVTVGLSSWGLFRLFVDFAGMPPWLAMVAVGGLDLVAVLMGKHALTVDADGDSSAPWNVALLVFTGLAATAQYWHALLAHQPQIIGITMAAFPVATVLLFEGQLRRAARLNGRHLGLVPDPRATLPLIIWLHFPHRAWTATRLAMLDRELSGDDLLTVVQGQPDTAPAEPQPRQAVLSRTGRKAIEPASNVEGVRDGLDRPQTVAAAVRSAIDAVGDNPEAVLSRVRTAHPQVSEDTVRRTMNRARTNGHSRGALADA